MRTTFIYTLSDPRSRLIRYVGKTDAPSLRAKQHRKRGNTIKAKWARSLIDSGTEPHFEILDEVPFDEWMFWEQYWIQVIRGWGFKLVNGDNGGLGHFRLSPDVISKISQKLKGRPNKALQKKVAKLNADGSIAQVYQSFQEAARAVGSHHSNICRAIRCGRMCGGFKWAKI